MPTLRPTIKGIFVNSHLRVLLEKKGRDTYGKFCARLGIPKKFRSAENVPVRVEVKIIKEVLKAVSDKPIPAGELEFQAGRFHFQNFSTTPLARIIFSVFRKRFKTLMLHADNIAGHVFRGVKFTSQNLGPTSVKITMENADYPVEHFQGLFQEWLEYSGHRGLVEAKVLGPDTYEYFMSWR